jgi:peptide methionine sulfoxide reductase MsrA
MGGTVNNPSYREVCYGTTGHLEVVKIIYDAHLISFETLAKLFF